MQHFYAYISRLKFIRRWGLMYSTMPENDSEHSLQVGFIAHGLALLAKEKYHKNVDPNHTMVLACFHDVSEVITGDLPTPVKYRNPNIKHSYKDLELKAQEQLLGMLNTPLCEAYEPILKPDESSYEWQLVKAADKLCAYIKCLEEVKAGNLEFSQAEKTIRHTLDQIHLDEVKDFMANFLPSFTLSLDEMSK